MKKMPAGSVIFFGGMALFALLNGSSNGKELKKVDGIPGETSAQTSIPDEKPFAPLEFSAGDLKKIDCSRHPDSWPTLDLCGKWQHCLLNIADNVPLSLADPVYPGDEGTEEGYWQKNFDDSAWSTLTIPIILVPDYWDAKTGKWIKNPEIARTGIKRGAGHLGWWRKNFILPGEYKGSKTILEFDQAGWWTKVWVNGKEIGEHIGANVRFNFDITEAAEFGKENVVAVRTWAPKGFGHFIVDRGISGELLSGPVRLTIRPEVYADQMLINPRIAQKTLEIQAEIRNTGKDTLSYEIKALLIPLGGVNASGDGVKETVSLGKVSLPSGTSSHFLSCPMASPVLWSPDNPFLYSIELFGKGSREKEIALGKDRFGFREFAVKGSDLYLNGRRIRLWGLAAYDESLFLPELVFFDQANYLRRLFLGVKKSGFNTLRSHTDNFHQLYPSFYDELDESGLLLQVEWHFRQNSFLWQQRELKEWIRDVHNHPSVVIWSLGNEVWDLYLKQDHPMYPALGPYLNKLYDVTKEADNQKRPIVISSGRAFQKGDKTDIEDVHVYAGTFHCSWTDIQRYIGDYNKMNKALFGENMKPLVNMEGGQSFGDSRPEMADPIKKYLLGKDPIDKEQYLRLVGASSNTPPSYIIIYMVSGGVKLYGLRNYTDTKKVQRLSPRVWKRVAEAFRLLDQECQGWTPNECFSATVAATRDGAIADAYENGYTRERSMLVEPLQDAIFVKLPLFYTFKRALNPVLPILDFYERNFYPGSVLNTKLYLVNETGQTLQDASLKAVLVGDDNRIVSEKKFLLPEIKPYVKEESTFTQEIPSGLKEGRYRLWLLVSARGKPVSDNCYDINVFAKRDLERKITTAKRVALYDKTGETAAFLDKLGVTFKAMPAFDDLSHTDVLIIGKDSTDKTFNTAGIKLRRWLEDGGRIVSLEQNRGNGFIPWLPELSWVPSAGHTFVDLPEANHPVLKGLTQDDFDSWNGFPCKLFQVELDPINSGVVGAASAISASWNQKPNMVIADYRVGKGTAFLTQLDALSRYGKDPVATRYAQNVIEYAVADEVTKYAARITGIYTENETVNPKLIKTIDLTKVANRGLKDDAPSDSKGGWDDTGENDLRNFPAGDQVFLGVPFETIDPAKNNDLGCIMLKGRALPTLPAEIKGIPIGLYVNKMYLLATSTFTSNDGAVAGKLVFNLEDGQTVEMPIVVGQNIQDWWNPKNLPHARVAWTGSNPQHSPVGVYMLKWENPFKDKLVKSFNFSAGDDALGPQLVLLAATAEEVDPYFQTNLGSKGSK